MGLLARLADCPGGYKVIEADVQIISFCLAVVPLKIRIDGTGSLTGFYIDDSDSRVLYFGVIDCTLPVADVNAPCF